MTQIEVINQ